MKSIITILSTAIIATLVSIPFAALGAQSDQEVTLTNGKDWKTVSERLDDVD